MAKRTNTSSANLGFEAKLWAAADMLRGNMDAAKYKHVVLGLIFLKYISDAFMEKYTALQADELADPEDKDEYLADYILANPPFNMEDWGYSKVKSDVRWRRFDQSSGNAQFSLPPGGERKQKDGSFVHVDGGNANYAWILHFLHHLAPHGTAGFVLANGSPAHERITLNIRQNRHLAGLRDTLLPRLLSGEIELPEAEAIAEETV